MSVSKSGPILVVATHPDDETLGCGGTVLKHKQAGKEVFWLVVTTIPESNTVLAPQREARKREIEAVAAAYGFDGVEQLGLPTTELDRIPLGEMMGIFSNVLSRINPHTVYLPFSGDIHSDHRLTFETAYGALKTFRLPSVRRVLMMETISETEFAPPSPMNAFVPNVFVNIDEFLEEKIRIMGVYAGEMGKRPFPRCPENIRAQATFRGCTAGCRYAEAFMLLKEIQ